MARVTEFFRTQQNGRPHPTEVECGYQVIIGAGERYLQLSTYGSDGRQSEKKVSQTLQLDRERAATLLNIIKESFPDLG
ncbi:hypothetical protein [Nonomuraea gerenzanensis]|uniref:hypothetical protein n=1 Tax=Nonomuraea gerenzanensis TaxID=93944 RepID=UPI001CD92CE3|nr:hypothetical protein [Nonomuraea gerenzanensis]UBU12692.1 hypothetical protein LCN96_51955 [Nonomuraea gerenzanensis]